VINWLLWLERKIMKQRMRYVFVLVLATSGIVVSACTGDDTSSDNNGGSGGGSGSKTGGSSSGGSASKAGGTSGGEAGSDSGGKAGSATAGTSATAGAGGAADGGMGGASDAGAGGNKAGAGGSDAGAAGMGGAGGSGEPALVYACGSATLIQKTCSAWVARGCADPTICSDCVTQITTDREGFQTDPPCDTCNAKVDGFYQCQVDAFESGDVAFGVQCFAGSGADGSDDCATAFLDDAFACQGYVGDPQNPQACPATWPPN
jgi:hypothetical protein